MPDPILINASRSDVGWSFWGPVFTCDQLAYRTHIEKRQFFGSDALTQGSMGHLVLAHYYARVACEQGGLEYEGQFYDDPDAFHDPETALRLWVDEAQARGEDAAPFIHNTLQLLKQYRIKEPHVADRVLWVERQGKMTLGFNAAGAFGLWTDDNLVAAAPLDCPELEVAHPAIPWLKHGAPICITKRLDLAVRARRDNKEYIWDHKVTGGSVGASVIEKYSMDGQFAVNTLLGEQLWNNFGGVALNLVQRRDPWGVNRGFVLPTPHRDRQFARHLWTKAHHLARNVASLVTGETTGEDWVMTQNDLTCYHRFGKCGAFDLCRYGG